MSFDITPAFVEEYKATVALLSQQMGSRFEPLVTVDTYTGDTGKSVDQIGEVTPQTKLSRHQDTPLISTPHDARWVFPEDKVWADLIDNEDKLRMIVELTSPYAINGAAGMQRAKDDIVIAAFFADSKTGEKGNTTTTFPAGNIVSSSLGASGATGMNVAKVKRGKRLLRAAEVDVEMDPITVAISAIQEEELLNEYEVKSKEFTQAPVMEEGMLRRWFGVNYVHSERLATNSSSERRCPMWARSGMHLGKWNDVQVRISERDDKNYSVQVWVGGTFGATRLEEPKVYDLPCAES